MCLILLAHKVHPNYPLVLAANRDEPTPPHRSCGILDDHPQIYGGRDLEKAAHGSDHARGQDRGGHQFPDGYAPKNGTHSRGELVSNFLCGSQQAAEYVRRIYRERKPTTVLT